MTALARLTLREPVRGLRLHAVRPAAGAAQGAPQSAPQSAPPSPRATALLNVRERGEREAQQHEALVRTLAAVRTALERVPAQVQESLRGVEAMAVELGLTVAREVVGTCLEQGLVDPAPIVARCLRAAVGGGASGVGPDGTPARLAVSLHPSDHSLVLNAIAADSALWETARGMELEADPTLARGAVRIATEAGRMLYDPREVLERISAEVRKESGR